MVKKIVSLLVIPVLGVFLLPNFIHADSPDPYTKQDGFNSGTVSGTFDPNLVKNWAIPTYPVGPPVIAGNSIYYLDFQPGRADRYIKSKNIYSEATWSYPLSLAVNASICPPVYAEGLIYSCDNDIVALDSVSGNATRRYISTGNQFNRVVSAGNLIIGFSNAYNRMIAFDKLTGLVVWSKNINKTPFGAVIIAEGKIVFNDIQSNGNGETYALNSIDGSIAWYKPEPGTAGDLIYNPTTKRLYDPIRKWSRDIADGTMRAANTNYGWPFIVDGKLISYYQTGSNISFMVNDALTGANISTKYNVVSNQSMGTNAIMANGKIYTLTYENRLLEFDLAGNCLNPTAPRLDSNLNFNGQILIDHGRLFTYDTLHNQIGYYDLAKVVTSSPESIHLISPYNIGTNHQYLGQLHSHYIPDVEFWSRIFNGSPSPSFTVSEYQKHGYDFMALTEHNQVVPMGYGGSIMQIQNAEESTQGIGKHHLLAIGVTSQIGDDSNDQLRIDAINMQGGIPILAHPDSWVYGALSKTIEGFKDLHFLEVYNHSVGVFSNIQGYAFDDLDYLLSKGYGYFLTSGDDFTPGDGFVDGGAVEVFAPSNSQADILSAIKAGNFYALQGSGAPRINNIAVGAGSILVSVTEPSDITFIGKGGQKLQVRNGVTASSYNPKGDEVYVRAEVRSSRSGKYAWTQPITVKKPSQSTTNVAGTFTVPLMQGSLKSVATDTVSARVVDQDEYPENLPPLGYFSPIYDFSTNGQVLDGTQLSINYNPADLPVASSNLSIYSFNETGGIWEKVASTINTLNNTVSASLSHFSKYTLSAEVPGDTQAPEVSLTTPSDLQSLSGAINLTASATDDQAVTSVSFTIDDKFIATDSFAGDGWSTTVNTADFTNGSHKLTLSAEDFSGNIGKKDYQITVSGGISPPGLFTISPKANDNLYAPSEVTGTFSSSLPVKDIEIYIDDIFITNAEINNSDKIFSKTMDWSLYRVGLHILRLKIEDEAGNTREYEIKIAIGESNLSSSGDYSPDSASKTSNLPASTLLIISKISTIAGIDQPNPILAQQIQGSAGGGAASEVAEGSFRAEDGETLGAEVVAGNNLPENRGKWASIGYAVLIITIIGSAFLFIRKKKK